MVNPTDFTQEGMRLKEEHPNSPVFPWYKWGPYVSERSWGTVREDYSRTGDAWRYCSYDMAKAKAFRWGEDGIAGLCDRFQILALSFAFWNGQDRELKERLFGVNPSAGMLKILSHVKHFICLFEPSSSAFTSSTCFLQIE